MLDTTKIPSLVVPGQLLCPQYDYKQLNGKEVVTQYVCGSGTKLIEYTHKGKNINVVTATLLGETQLTNEESSESDEAENAAEGNGHRIIETIRISVGQANSRHKTDFTNNLPKEGDIVLTKVTRITLQRANMEILAVENEPTPVDSGIGSNGHGIVAAGGGSSVPTFSMAQVSSDFSEPFRGILRSQDVRSTERDRVKMIDCFKPGDIVRAQILSLGDSSNYYLSTARNDLGVVFAKSANGAGELMYALDWQTMVAPSTGITEKRKCAKPF